MSVQDAPPLTAEQIEFEAWWRERRGTVGFVSFGRNKRGEYHAEFARDAWAAWQAARASSLQQAWVPCRALDFPAAIFYFNEGVYRVEYRNDPDYAGKPTEWTVATPEVFQRPAVNYQFRLCLPAEAAQRPEPHGEKAKVAADAPELAFEVCENCGAAMPEGCGGQFEDEEACMLPKTSPPASAVAEPDRHPVAWMNENGLLLSDLGKRHAEKYKGSMRTPEPIDSYRIPLYTAPPPIARSAVAEPVGFISETDADWLPRGSYRQGVVRSYRLADSDVPLYAAPQPPAQAARDATEKHMRAFFDRYGLPNLTNPSCLACGQQKLSRAIEHAELPNIYICTDCVAKIRSPAQATPIEDALAKVAFSKGDEIAFLVEKWRRTFAGRGERDGWRICADELEAALVASSPAAPAPVELESEDAMAAAHAVRSMTRRGYVWSGAEQGWVGHGDTERLDVLIEQRWKLREFDDEEDNYCGWRVFDPDGKKIGEAVGEDGARAAIDAAMFK